jgi:hypothetical protein
VADWQLSQYDLKTNNFREEARASELPEGWVNATLNIGLSREQISSMISGHWAMKFIGKRIFPAVVIRKT